MRAPALGRLLALFVPFRFLFAFDFAAQINYIFPRDRSCVYAAKGRRVFPSGAEYTLPRRMARVEAPTDSAAVTEQQLSGKAVLPLRFRVLLLDHDDTTVRGTEEIHYPAHVESVNILRPDLTPVTLEGWFLKNHEPGVSAYLKSLFTTEQMTEEHAIWERAIDRRTPSFYSGMPELLCEFRARGGKIAVVSHSPAHAIWNHYELHPRAEQIRPDLVLGWDTDPSKRKPSVWPAHQALERLGVSASEALVIDDLSPGVKMGKAAGICVAAAGWGHSVPPIQEYMRRECQHYFGSVEDLADFLFCGVRAGISSL